MNIEAMKLALEIIQDYVDEFGPYEKDSGAQYVINILNKAIAEVEKQEPVAWMNATRTNAVFREVETSIPNWSDYYYIPLYTHPQPKREWVGLTDEEILKFQGIVPYTLGYDLIEFSRAIEAKLKEKNT
jgi:hypothetical protein